LRFEELGWRQRLHEAREDLVEERNVQTANSGAPEPPSKSTARRGSWHRSRPPAESASTNGSPPDHSPGKPDTQGQTQPTQTSESGT
jgi:hypothetical protein